MLETWQFGLVKAPVQQWVQQQYVVETTGVGKVLTLVWYSELLRYSPEALQFFST